MIDSIDVVDGCGTQPSTGRPDGRGGPAGGHPARPRVVLDGQSNDWTAEPTMISGSGRYDAGEYVWTDYAYDDAGTGAFQYPGEGEPLIARTGAVGAANARGQRYGSNAADVIELRFTADQDFVYMLVRLNFLNAVDSTAVGLALDLDGDAATGAAAWPRGAQVTTPGTDLFITAFGTCALVQTADGVESALDAAGGSARVGTADNVMELALPRELLGSTDRIRVAGGAGLWDAAGEQWMVPTVGLNRNRNGNASDRPAGARTPLDPAIFNLLFRDDETTSISTLEDPTTSPRAFQTQRQNETLSTGTTGDYALQLDLTRLGRNGPSDPIPVRRGGERDFVRLYRSAIDAEGVIVGGSGGNFALFLGRYQPYAVYLPACYELGSCPWPTSRAPVVLAVHGGSGSHLEAGPDVPISEGGTYLYGLRGAYAGLEDAIAPVFVRTLGRGQRNPWHRGYGELDELEALAAATARYDLDPERRVVTGGSLGGYGTLRLASLYPDLWSGAFAHCPAEFENSIGARYVGNVAPTTQPFTVEPIMPNLLNVPLRQASGTLDPLVPITADHRIRDAAVDGGLDFAYTEYLNGGHCWDNSEGVHPWIGNHLDEMVELLRRPRETAPARVRYRVDPRQFFPGPETIGVADIRDLGIDYDGAYWVSGLELRDDVLASASGPDATDAVVGGIDATSHARPGWHLSTDTCGDSVGLGGSMGGNPHLKPRNPTPNAYYCQAQERSGSPSNELDLVVEHVDRVTVDVPGAGLASDVPLLVHAVGDGPLTLTLAGIGDTDVAGPCVTSVSIGANATTVTLDLSSAPCTISVGGRDERDPEADPEPPTASSGACPWTEFTRLPGVSTFPDTNTQVYQCVYAAGPTHETVITGFAPAARFWSFAILDQARREIDNISDTDVTLGPDGSYRIVVRPACNGAPDCLETSASPAPTVPGLIYYRQYVPDATYGGVPLPSVIYRFGALGSAPPVGLSQLLADQEDALTSPVMPGGEGYEALASASGLEQPVTGAGVGADPQAERFHGTGAKQVRTLETAGVPAPVIALLRQVLGQGGFGGTQDNAYLTMGYDMRNGNVVVRAKAPTYRAQHADSANSLGRGDRSEQVRYWSLCTTQATRSVDCVRDEQVPVDQDGYFEVVLSPTCPVEGYRVCLRTGLSSAAGPAAVGTLLYRNTLAHPAFYNENGPTECPAGPSMFCGDYALVARYTARADQPRGQLPPIVPTPTEAVAHLAIKP